LPSDHLLILGTRRPPSIIPHPRDLDPLATGAHALAVAVASPAFTSSTICSIMTPCAIMIASVQPSRHDASSSSAP